MAKEDERKFMALIETVNHQDGWSVILQDGHRQSYWYIKNPTDEYARFPVPITYDAGHCKGFRLRVQQLGFVWSVAEKAYKDHLKIVAKEEAEEQRNRERRLAAKIREDQDLRAAALEDGSKSKARWERPRRYTVPVRITPEWALPFVTDMLGPSAREPFPEAGALTKAYLAAILSKQITDFPGPVILDWNGRLLSGHELLLAVIEADRPITCDVTHDADPADYPALNLAVCLLTGTIPTPEAEDQPDEQPDGEPEHTDDELATDEATADTAATEEDGEQPDPGQPRSAKNADIARLRRRALLRMLYQYDEIPVAAWGEDRITAADLDRIEPDYADLDRAVTLGSRLTGASHRGRPSFSPAPAGVFVYLVMRNTPEAIEGGEFEQFIEGAIKGYGLTKGDPRAALHDWLYRNARPLPGKHQRKNGPEQLMVLLKCWNAFMEDRPMRLTDAAWTPDEHTVLCYSGDSEHD